MTALFALPKQAVPATTSSPVIKRGEKRQGTACFVSSNVGSILAQTWISYSLLPPKQSVEKRSWGNDFSAKTEVFYLQVGTCLFFGSFGLVSPKVLRFPEFFNPTYYFLYLLLSESGYDTHILQDSVTIPHNTTSVVL